ncbi:MAG TPA: methyl-accepting chemotaxis protein [Ktedonobacteraceae bacterium]|nr:methyl-accepting chemotaxis protein [Ktedonobacteraceae bacterium]
MVRFISNVPIFRRLFIAFAIAALIPGIVIVSLGNFYVSSLTTQGQAVRTSFDAQSTASQEETNLQRMNAGLEAFHYEIYGSLTHVIQDPSYFSSGALVGQEVRHDEAEFDQALANYQSNYELATSANMSTIKSILLSDNPANGNSIIQSQQQALNFVINLWPKYKQAQDKELTDLETIQNQLQNPRTTPLSTTQINNLYNSQYETVALATNYFTDLKNNWQQVVDTSVSMGKAVTAVGPSQTQPILVATAISLALTILLVIATGWIVNITITQPLRQLDALTKRIAKGNTNARAKVSSRDEIAKVATAMNNMLDNIVHLIQEAQAQRDSLQGQVEKLVSEVSGVGEGDLRVQAEVTADALGVLADSFNYMVEELGSLVVRVKMVAQEVENSTTMTFERMSQLVESADVQIQQIGAAAVEVERMADSSRQVADRAQSLYAVAREARQTAQTGRESVLQTVEGMDRINTYVQDTAAKVQTLGDSSREIDNIVTVIANIAHQTNRLALDAAIQAAMAGDNGKGFGAVAADIRRLAERAKDQASMIARIVRSVREDIGAAAVSMKDTEHETSIGTKLAQEAGASLESIFSVVERQGREIESINQLATQQLRSSNTVVQIMHSVSDSTQRSSHSTREAAQNMERLARLAEQLLASVEAFKLRDNLNYYAPANVTITPEEQHDNYLTVSGVFRTVTATAQSADQSRNLNALPPASTPASYPPASYPGYAAYQQPYQQQGNGNYPQQGNSNYPQQSNGNFAQQGNGSQGRPQQRPPVPPEWQ